MQLATAHVSVAPVLIVLAALMPSVLMVIAMVRVVVVAFTRLDDTA